MRQEINLYQDELRERAVAFATRQAVAVLGLIIAATVALAFWMQTRVDAPRAELATAQTRLQALDEELLQLSRLAEEHRPDPALAIEVTRLERDLRHLRRVRSAVASLAEQPALSAYLAALGWQRPEGLWLSEVVVAGDGGDVRIAGHTLEPDLVPRFIAALGNELPFFGMRFHTLAIERPQDEARWVDFRIESGCPSLRASGNDLTPCPPPQESPR